MSHDDNCSERLRYYCRHWAGSTTISSLASKQKKNAPPFPKIYWNAAVVLTERYSICNVSKALGLNYTALKEQVIKTTPRHISTEPVCSSTFVELPCPAPALDPPWK